MIMIKEIGKYIYIFLFSFSALAFDVEYSVNPSQPAKGVPFRLTFKIQTEGNTGQPVITFDKGTLEIISRDEPSVTLRTLFINGRLETSKSYEIAYELIADRAMPVRLTNVSVRLDNEVKRIHDIGINVLNKPKEPEDVFVELEIPKTDIYIGEGVNIDYYVYSRVQLLNQEIQQFPKLNGVIKRFRMPNQKAERVEKDGKIYTRYLIYAARVYPEKVGKIEIDPIKLLIQYASGQSISPFGGFGFGIPRAKSRSFLSQKTYLNVRELPPFNESGQFTGLVGNHTFNLTGAGNNYLENEPIEIKLEVNGEGALEKMEPIKLISHDLLEEFDTKINFEETSLSSARKLFEHTYLGRGAISLESQKISLYTFDPSTEKYAEHTLSLGAINVGSLKSSSSNTPINNTEKKENSQSPEASKKPEVTSPMSSLVGPDMNTMTWNLLNLKFIALMMASLMIIIVLLQWLIGLPGENKRQLRTLKRMIKGQYSLSELLDLVEFIARITGTELKPSIEEQLKVLKIDEQVRLNLKELLIAVENSNFNLYKKGELPKMNRGTYKLIKNIIESYAKNIQDIKGIAEPLSE
jgi:hypothetical protein